MPARTTSNKRKRTSHREPVSESDFSDFDESDLEIGESDLEDLETDSELEDSEEEFSSDEEESDSSDEESEDEQPRKRRRSSTPKAKKATKRGKSKTGKKTTKQSKSKTGKKTTKRSKSKAGKKTTKRSTSKTGKTGKKTTKRSKSKTAKSKSSGLSEKRLKNRNIPIPMLSAVVEPPKDENGNVITPVKQDRKFLLVNADGSATTKAYTAKGPYQAALKAANRLEVSKAGEPKTEIRLREPNSQIMYVFEGQREKLEPEKCIYFYCEDNSRKKVSFEEKQAILKKNKDAKIIPICHKSNVKRIARVKLTEEHNDTDTTVEATA